MRVALTGLLALYCSAAAFASPPPVTAFTNAGRFESMKISTKGTYLALTRHTPEHEVLIVLRMGQ
jgi:hypothetical protein